MTTISFSSFSKCLSFNATGHACYAPIGEDIVCSAISTLAFTLAQYLLQKSAEGVISEPDIDIKDDGDITIRCEARTDEEYKFLKNTFEMAECGYVLLQNTYPKHVSIKKCNP